MHDREKWKPVSPRDKREGVCAEIIHRTTMHDRGADESMLTNGFERQP
jgi:hypothetical protein